MIQIDKFIGIPYKDYGRDFDGCDCYGLVYLFYKHILHIDLPSFTDIYEHGNTESISVAIRKNLFCWQKVAMPEFGDCILFNLHGNGTHIGIFLSKLSFLHTVAFRKISCIERLTHPFWKSRIEGFYRYVKDNSYATYL